jgi:hypothetical protein
MGAACCKVCTRQIGDEASSWHTDYAGRLYKSSGELGNISLHSPPVRLGWPVPLPTAQMYRPVQSVDGTSKTKPVVISISNSEASLMKLTTMTVPSCSCMCLQPVLEWNPDGVSAAGWHKRFWGVIAGFPSPCHPAVTLICCCNTSVNGCCRHKNRPRPTSRRPTTHGTCETQPVSCP